jgi:hypothetical protein
MGEDFDVIVDNEKHEGEEDGHVESGPGAAIFRRLNIASDEEEKAADGRGSGQAPSMASAYDQHCVEPCRIRREPANYWPAFE